ncbi:hypothetical protein LTR29_005146 [Friedmanniomyces endolithicus]|nr:hypothetical protein LTS09_007822 [Friedmanniomyces endolithicus]KAK0943358.1 hypothetical protein LTR29_005146 [Friedmanniomyces endolithicus]KAK1824730.1 hypothetical protein LTR12_000787 [Friedmanniomyces endolithicus]
MDVAARNAIMLLVAITEPNKDNAVDCILHVWYSSNIQQKHLELLEAKIRPLVEDVILKIADKAAGSLQRKTWKFGNNTLRLTLVKEQWSALLRYLEVPTGATEAVAPHIGTTLTMARRDNIDRGYLAQLPPHRVCKEKFRASGILLPFGESSEAFDVPNPTFRQTTAGRVMDPADPLDGWDWREVLSTSTGLATDDLYGKLTAYLKQLLAKFHDGLRSRAYIFYLFSMDAASLPHHLPKDTFARIEVSNIVDVAYLGIGRTLDLLGPLLQPQSVNPHATMLTLFMNAVMDTVWKMQEHKQITIAETELAMQYMSMLTPKQMLGSNIGMLIHGHMVAMRDAEKYFDTYMQWNEVDVFPTLLQMALKELNTITDKWPFRLKLLPHEDGAREEYRSLFSSSHLGFERYVEWSRTT